MWLKGPLLCLVIELLGISYGQFSGTNIALKKSATQKPDTYCAYGLNICFNASKAVDGKLETNGYLYNGYCTHTIEQYETAASWSVDFGAPYYINGIRVHNRKPIYNVNPPIGSRLRNFILYGTTPEQQNGSLLYTYNYIFIDNNYPDVVEILLPENSYYSGIRIEIPYRGKDEPTILTLCEVEVYSVICELNNDSARTVILSDNLNNGSEANFKCNVGFYLSSNYSLLCKDGKWSRDPPTCLEVFCPKPSLQHGRYQTSGNCSSMLFNESLPFNCAIVAQCDKGYVPIDGGTKVCTQSGDWSELRSVCQLANCSLPKDTVGKHYVFTNGSEIVGDTVLYGTNITQKCNSGYKMNGEKENITCLENNSWTNQSHECILVTCEHPGSIINGSFQDGAGNAYTEGQKNYSENIYIHCVEGYTPAFGSNVITCQEDGHWDNLPAACVAVTCASLEETSGLTYEYSDQDTIKTSPYNSTVRISCVNEPETTQVRICSQAGHWNGNSPVCGTMVNTAAVIGGAVAGGAVLLLVIILLLIVLKRRGTFWRKKNAESNQYEGLHERSVQRAGSTYQEIKNVGTSFVVYQNAPTASEFNVNYESADQSIKDLSEAAIPVQHLADFVFINNFTNERFQTEFEKLPEADQTRFSEALKMKNEDKNRYRGLYAYDDTRVVLDVEADGETDYINACYIYGFRKKKKFIASQGPTKELMADFWRMIWQTNSRKIVMLTNLVELGKHKCEQYWPNVGREQYGTVTVTSEETDVYADFVLRKFTVRKGDSQARQVTQFHFTAWPGYGVPNYASSFILFRHKVNYMTSQQEEPVIVHDSAGVGRTGAFIALDFITDQAEALGYVDVYGCVKNLRQQRVELVQTLDQYKFLHRAVVNTIVFPILSLLSSKFQKTYKELEKADTKTKKSKLDLQFERLKRLSPVAPEDQYASAKIIQNRSKNRYSDIFPAEEFMPQLRSDSMEKEYINAVFLPSYKARQAFIITQTPLDTTKADFWKLVWQNDIRTIIMMNHLKEMKEGEVYWPKSDEKLEFANISVITDSKTTVEQHTVINMKASLFSTTRSVRLIQCGGWQPYKSLPDSTQVLLSLLNHVQTWQRQSGNHTVLVHCMNGAEKSGLYCVLAAVIERMKIEQDVAIPQVIEEIWNAREQIIPSVDQYRFCYEAVLAYIQMNSTYYNCTV